MGYQIDDDGLKIETVGAYEVHTAGERIWVFKDDVELYETDDLQDAYDWIDEDENGNPDDRLQAQRDDAHDERYWSN